MKSYEENYDEKSSAEIARDIHRTQDRLDAKLNGLKDDLTVDRLINLVLRKLNIRSYGDAYRQSRSGLTKAKMALRENPAASGLVGAGALVALMNGILGTGRVEQACAAGIDRSRSGLTKGREGLSSLKESLSSWSQRAGASVGDRASEVHSAAKDGLSSKSSAVGDRASQAKQAISDKTSQAGEFSKENPLAVGLGLFAAGIALSALAPRTQAEDELIGKHADQLKKQAREKADELKFKAEEKAADVVSSGRDQIRQKADQGREAIKDQPADPGLAS